VGTAKFISSNTIQVNDKTYTSPHIVIATGGAPSLPADTPGVEYGITSDGFFDELNEVPKRVAVVGAGYIAVELAGIMHGLGSEVHLIIRREGFLREFDNETVKILQDEMVNSGVKIHTNTTTGKVIKQEDGSLQMISVKGDVICVVDKLIWAIGRYPLTDISLESAGVKLKTSGHIIVDEFQNTSVNGIYALGDVCGNIELTPVAIAAGRALSERLFNNKPESKFDYDRVPTVIFSHPPIGTCGISEERAIEKYGKESVKVYKSQFVGMYYSLLTKKSKTFMKMITAGPNEQVVGLHLMGVGCDEMIQGFAVAMKMGATKKDFNASTALHPTSSEEVVLL